ncbi:solute carrier family 28 member 3 [Asbolus verrucosus]|uniref:Solute carrier family 28 member 3 n=1 Tax=Asbolus verrucosus TaxID=1661398 RepID=A0A482VPE8_ASBVE|nr:solute carrier family 28 member 3 [Asbolus verrucosus]
MSEYTSTENIIKENVENLQIEDGRILENKQRKKSSRYWINLALKLITIGLIWAHFIWATYYFIDKTSDTLEATTCTGYGFWMILFIFIHFGIMYKLALKPYVMPKFRKYVWNPTVQLLKKIKYGAIIFYVLVLIAIIAFLVVDTDGDRHRLISLCGLVVYVIIGFVLSSNKRKIQWHTVTWGLILQFTLGLLMIRWETGRNVFNCVGDKVDTFLKYALNGSAFVYGNLLVNQESVFAFNALAAIYFFSFIINILFYYGIMQNVVAGMGKFIQWVMGTSICESVNSATTVFLGMSEAPLMLKPYLKDMTESEIHSIMTAGFAMVSGTVLAAYISFGASPAHLITASVMSAPAALCYSKLVCPETEEIVATEEKIEAVQMEFDSVLDAASKGTQDASEIVIAIISSLIAFIAFIYFINGILGWLGMLVGFTDESEIWSVELILGKIFIPITYIMGVQWDECEKVGQLIGIKTMVNEFVAFQKMGSMNLTPKSKVIATYSICGFANPGSVGIMLSTLGTLMPTRKEVLSKLVMSSFVAGCITCFMTACVAGLLIGDGEDV